MLSLLNKDLDTNTINWVLRGWQKLLEWRLSNNLMFSSYFSLFYLGRVFFELSLKLQQIKTSPCRLLFGEGV